MKTRYQILAALIVWILPGQVLAETNWLTDVNGDSVVNYLAFGDSITVGVGDGIVPGVPVNGFEATSPGPGYPERISLWGGIPAENSGISGEELTSTGYLRFPPVIAGSSADLVGILEGANDAWHSISIAEYRGRLQRLINVASALGRIPVLITIPPPCCNHAPLNPFTRAYSQVVRELAVLNQLPLADVERAWDTTCEDINRCQLVNLPEGLHPNEVGYDAVAQTVLATLFGVDIFANDGAAQLESVLGLAPGTVVVKPAADTQG